jgi:hypothetical protein
LHQTIIADRNTITRTIPPTIEITPDSPAFNGYYKALLEPEANTLGKLLCEDLHLDTTGQPSHSTIQKVSLASRYQNHLEIIAYIFGTFHSPLLNHIDSPLLSPNLQYPNYPEKEELEPLEEPLSTLLPFWKQEEIDTSNRDTNLGLTTLKLRHMLNSLTNQLPHLTALPDVEEPEYSALFNDEENSSLDPMDSILRLYPESYKHYIEDQERSFAKRR